MTQQLRKGRDRCTSRRRDGQPCGAPAVEGLLVCRRHGGGTAASQIASQRYRLRMRYLIAEQEWMEARGTKGEDAALTRHGNALSELRYFEQRVAYLRVLEAEVRRRKAAAANALKGQQAGSPPFRGQRLGEGQQPPFPHGLGNGQPGARPGTGRPLNPRATLDVQPTPGEHPPAAVG